MSLHFNSLFYIIYIYIYIYIYMQFDQADLRDKLISYKHELRRNNHLPVVVGFTGWGSLSFFVM
jgi:hypothetical protein